VLRATILLTAGSATTAVRAEEAPPTSTAPASVAAPASAAPFDINGKHVEYGKPVYVAGFDVERYRISAEGEAPRYSREVWRAPPRGKNFLVPATEFRRMQKLAARWEAAYLAMSAVDAVQTISAIESGKATELNPLFGKRPSAGKVIGLKAALGAVHYFAFNKLNAKNPNKARQAALISFGMQTAVAGANMRVFF
jgi:hypothetical protein